MLKIESTHEFYHDFGCDDDCRQFLFDLKWKDGFSCIKCGHKKSWRGRTNFHKRCASCDYDESCTANTIFHKVKFPLLKAFGIAFQIAVPKKGRSTVDLARDFKLFQPTVWLFKNKVQKIMGTQFSDQSEISLPGKKFSVDSIIMTHRGENLNGFQRFDLYLNEHSCGEEKKLICSNLIILPEGEREISRLVQGQFKEPRTNMILWNFKSWLTGIHHHCSLAFLKGYLNEFFFKYNYRKERETIWYRLIERSLVGRNILSFTKGHLTI
ncbi:MAG: transposase [Sphingobacteriales bacterium]|nr:MAG: transposase [Sphingobacteriales bacterium]